MSPPRHHYYDDNFQTPVLDPRKWRKVDECTWQQIEEGNLMTPAQYKAALKALDLSQERGGEWLGIAPRTSQGYALGEYPVPEPVAKLLRLCVKLKLKPDDVK